jgi:hypothetical protein
MIHAGAMRLDPFEVGSHNVISRFLPGAGRQIVLSASPKEDGAAFLFKKPVAFVTTSLFCYPVAAPGYLAVRGRVRKVGTRVITMPAKAPKGQRCSHLD